MSRLKDLIKKAKTGTVLDVARARKAIHASTGRLSASQFKTFFGPKKKRGGRVKGNVLKIPKNFGSKSR